ncbi:MAG: phosphoribosylanthranilate isomerase [Planctomycetes bacterium]|nr:phosphoribosylanthranilate isomerase [Planctomycetota bacterium]
MTVRVKVCGLTRAEDVDAAVEAGADAAGFVLWSGSPRAVDIHQARELAARLPPFVTAVGVFVDPDPRDAVSFCQWARIGTVQLHGTETPVEVQWFQGAGLRVIRAVRALPSGQFPEPSLADAYLLDSTGPSGEGGTGRRVDWEQAARFAQVHPRTILAGGLGPENVAEAVRLVRPHAVDVSSGVEVAPGVKDPGRLRAFVEAAKGVRP